MIQDVSETALMVAMWRDQENHKRNPLFRDPYAIKLAGTRGQEIVAEIPKRRAALGVWMMAIRTHIIDEMIRDAIANGFDTILNLGAGLDTRPYRMTLPQALKWIEVDCAKIIELKEQRLAMDTPKCQLQRIVADLSNSNERQSVFAKVAGQSKRCLVLTEGVIPYLNEADVGSLADDLRKHPSFKAWIADYFSPFVMKYRKKSGDSAQMANAPFLFEPKDYFEFFRKHGWTAKQKSFIPVEATRLKRPPPFFLRAATMLRWFFIKKQQREEMRQSMAYVLFE